MEAKVGQMVRNLTSTCEILFLIQSSSPGFPAGVDHDKSALQEGTSLLALLSTTGCEESQRSLVKYIELLTDLFSKKLH